MSTSVKISDADKRKLEKLQALVTLRTSKKITQQEILSKLINAAAERSDSFVNQRFEAGTAISDEDYEKTLSLISDWGVKTRWEDIDKILYGEHRARRVGNTKRPRREQ